MQALSHPTSAQPDATVYKFRLNGCAIVLVFQCLVMTLPTLKLLKVPVVSNWSWLWVTLPVWAPSVLLAVVLVGEKVMQWGKAKAASPARNLVVEPSPINC
ncbi:hypothetical protein FNT36_00115 [Hymenobacter setariae]|uniref:Uncharacterized protein n=1 Tax=Hymenobacter setariae TaxID=2594794 RepID=A0A558C189_9BACT|nr:hypothetical protein [Hymenobacter setariae]TVT42545.1 hypothetical protein FNT36_00115 [Hymenobacter setariae]